VDERTDLAVLRITLEDGSLPYLDFSNSDDLAVGDLVLAIGNPFGVGQTVTSGIVSALARTQVNVADVSSFIQTDAAINPGNSGGALIGMDGKLIGINTAIFSKTGGSLGIGFAVPSNMVHFVVDGLITSGQVTRPWLGAWGQPVTSDLANALGLDRPVGILINDMWPGSAAEFAGLSVGDVILSINKRDVHNPNELEYRIASLGVGGSADLSVYRDGRYINLPLPLKKAPEKPARDTTTLDNNSILSGATVVNISPALVEELDLESFVPGVMIFEIMRNSSAAYYRFRPGDRIMELNGALVTSVDHLATLTNNNNDSWEIVISRNGKRLNLRVSQ
jgi:serine protease Do